jgi:hypothetical protein
MINNKEDRVGKVYKVHKVRKVHKVLKFGEFVVPHLQWGSLFDLWDKGILPKRLAVVAGVITFIVSI